MEEYIDRENEALSDEARNALNDFVAIVLNDLIRCADEHTVERDKFVRYFATLFSTMSEISTFETYEVTPTNEIETSAEIEKLQKELDVYKNNVLSMVHSIPNITRADRQDIARQIFTDIEKLFIDFEYVTINGMLHPVRKKANGFYIPKRKEFEDLRKKHTEGR